MRKQSRGSRSSEVSAVKGGGGGGSGGGVSVGGDGKSRDGDVEVRGELQDGDEFCPILPSSSTSSSSFNSCSRRAEATT